MTDNTLRIGFALLGLLLVLAVYAWMDGGRETVREMAHPVAVPGAE